VCILQKGIKGSNPLLSAENYFYKDKNDKN